MKGGATMQKTEPTRVAEHNRANHDGHDEMPSAIKSAGAEESQQAQAFDVVVREAAAGRRHPGRIKPAQDPQSGEKPPTAQIVRELYAALKRRWEHSGLR